MQGLANSALVFRFIGLNQAEWSTSTGVPEQGDLATLASRVNGRRLLLAAPSEAIILTRAKVPGRNRGTWLKAIPYALEEGLAEDVEDLHFALGKAGGLGEPVPVAVVRRETLSSWLVSCAQMGVAPNAIVADALLLPFFENTWSVLLEKDRAVVRTGPTTGFACERDSLALMLNLALNEAGEQRPEQVRLWGEAPPELKNLGIALSCLEPDPQPLAIFVDNPHTINLLQGSFSRKAQLGKWLRPWRATAVLVGVWLAVQFALQLSDYWLLQRERSHLLLSMEQTYRDAVPNARRIVNPRVQLENRLRELSRGRNNIEGGFFELLYRSGRTLADFQGVNVRGLRYKDNQLDLDLEGASLEIFDQLKRRLENQSDLETQMRTTKREGTVESQVTLKKTPS